MNLNACMAEKSIVNEKALAFALEIIELYQFLKEKREFVLSKQLLRSATAIGANISEALAGGSRRDFMYKMSLASKESRESFYWLTLLQRSQMVRYNFSDELAMCEELIRMLTSIVKTTSTKTKISKLKTKD